MEYFTECHGQFGRLDTNEVTKYLYHSGEENVPLQVLYY